MSGFHSRDEVSQRGFWAQHKPDILKTLKQKPPLRKRKSCWPSLPVAFISQALQRQYIISISGNVSKELFRTAPAHSHSRHLTVGKNSTCASCQQSASEGLPDLSHWSYGFHTNIPILQTEVEAQSWTQTAGLQTQILYTLWTIPLYC